MNDEVTIEDVLAHFTRVELLALQQAIRTELHRRVKARRVRLRLVQ